MSEARLNRIEEKLDKMADDVATALGFIKGVKWVIGLLVGLVSVGLLKMGIGQAGHG